MKKLYWCYKQIIIELKYFRSLFLGFFQKKELRTKPSIRHLHNGNLLPDYARPVCFFCSYDKNSTIKKNIYYYLDELKLAGFDIIFISSSDGISETDLKKLSNLCIKIINRENRGYDFYGWKIGLQIYPQYPLHKALLLANDSVLGPFFNLRGIVDRLESNDADIVSMTDSLQFHPHLQSYFLYCKKSVSVSKEFTDFFNRIRVLGFKMAIVRKYEVGFSQSLSRRFKLCALFSLENNLNRIQLLDKPMNLVDATHDLWKPLITELKFPFLKKRVVVKKSLTIEEIAKVLAESDSTYSIDILADYNS
jgi:rhamnosyltransferase